MDFDLRTCDAAYYFVLDFMGMTPDEYITERIINCENDFETFWSRNIERIKSVDISGLRLMAFHVVGSLDECREIKENGLMNLQSVLSKETILKKLLEKAGVTFDIPNKLVSYKGNSYDIDYEKYKGRHFLMGIDEKLDRVAHRVYYDFCVNGFMANDNFELDEYRDPPYEDWFDLDDDMKLKKWMLSHAIDRAHDDLGMTILYIKDDVIIPANQIIDISEL